MAKKIKFGKTLEVTEIEEKLVQEEFEHSLSDFEDGLKYIASFVGTAVGTIDTLAIDEDKRPVIIEFKAPGADATQALMQALDYYSWASEPGNFAWLDKYIRKIKKDALNLDDQLENNIRIIIVASEFDERLKRAVSGLQPDTTLVSYKLLEKDEGEIWLLPVIEVDTSQIQRKELLPPKLENDHFKGKEDKKALYEKIKTEVLSKIDSSIKINPAPQDYIGLIGRKTFCGIHIKKGWLRLDLPLTNEEAKNERYVWKEGWGWGYIHLENEKQIPEVMELLKKSYNK